MQQISGLQVKLLTDLEAANFILATMQDNFKLPQPAKNSKLICEIKLLYQLQANTLGQRCLDPSAAGQHLRQCC